MTDIQPDAPVPMQVGPGTHVVVELVDESGASDRLEFDIVPDAQADFARGFLGAGTPLAQAIVGQPAGKVVPYKVGDVVEARILGVTAQERAPEPDAETKRQNVIQKARDEAERMSDMAFALAVGSNWGDYDPGDPKE